MDAGGADAHDTAQHGHGKRLTTGEFFMASSDRIRSQGKPSLDDHDSRPPTKRTSPASTTCLPELDGDPPLDEADLYESLRPDEVALSRAHRGSPPATGGARGQGARSADPRARKAEAQVLRAKAKELVDEMFERGELRRLDNNGITEPKLFFAAYGVTTRKCSVVDE